MKDLANHKFRRVVKMDKRNRYTAICDENKEIKNNMKSQLDRFKSTLNRGVKTEGEDK